MTTEIIIEEVMLANSVITLEEGPQFSTIIEIPDQHIPPSIGFTEIKYERRELFSAADREISIIGGGEDEWESGAFWITKITVRMTQGFHDDASATLEVKTKLGQIFVPKEDIHLQNDDFEMEFNAENLLRAEDELLVIVRTSGRKGQGFVVVEYQKIYF